MSAKPVTENKNCYFILDMEEKKALHARDLGAGLSPFAVGIPLVDAEDKTIEEIYYFRWHTYCKHIKLTPSGYVVTEFFPPVPWAGIYNTINCPAGHHLSEGRWLHEQKYLTDYTRFWFTKEAEPRKYSFWAANAALAVAKVTGDFSTCEALYEDLTRNYHAWVREKGMENGLFYQIDSRDGMEYSAGGSGIRPTINAYMYGDALALSRIAARLGKTEEAQDWKDKAEAIREKVEALLWDADAQFYKTLAEDLDYEKAPVRELIGYVPWCFDLPGADKACAWRFLNDENHFYAPYGPTTTERCCPDFMKEFDHECLWNGPSWPFATAQTLTALGNLLCGYEQSVMKKSDYFALLKQYAACHYLTENGRTVPFIDENLDPFTGEWLARKIMLQRPEFNPNNIVERGMDYNHSTFCDLVLSGLAGVRAEEEDVLTVEPLFGESDLAYFCADGILYHGHAVSVLWDRDGTRYGRGAGMSVYVDGACVYKGDGLEKVSLPLDQDSVK